MSSPIPEPEPMPVKEDFCLLLRMNEESPYDDKEGHFYHYSSNVPNHTKIEPGRKVVFDRRAAEGGKLIGSAIIGEVIEERGIENNIAGRKPVRYYKAELCNYDAFENPRRMSEEERSLLTYNKRLKYNVQHSIRPIVNELFESLISPIPHRLEEMLSKMGEDEECDKPPRLVEEIDEIINNIRNFGSAPFEQQNRIPIGTYFVYDPISGWIAPCKFAGFIDMSIEMYLKYMEYGKRVYGFDGHRTQKKIGQLCGPPEDFEPAKVALTQLIEKRGLSDEKEKVIYIAGSHSEKSPLLERFCKEIRSMRELTHAGEKTLYKPLMMLAACCATFEKKPLTYESLNEKFEEFALALNKSDLKAYYPYGRLRAGPDDPENGPFWKILDTEGNPVTAAIDSQSPALSTRIEWIDSMEECIKDERLLTQVIDSEPLKGRYSTVLQCAQGYRELLLKFLLLYHCLKVTGRCLTLQLKSIYELYEYWCFLHIATLLRKHLKICDQDLVHLTSDGLTVRLQTGESSKLCFKGEQGISASLLYNPLYPWPDETISDGQIPDIVLKIERIDDNCGRTHIGTYIFDAKYRIETREAYKCSYNCAGPPRDAINQMHRYRDAIVDLNSPSGSYERIAYGAYVLFPFSDEKAYSQSKFYSSIRRLNVGAFPALPGHTRLLDNYILNLLNRSGILHDYSAGTLRLPSWERFEKESRQLVIILHTDEVSLKWTRNSRKCFVRANTSSLRPSMARYIAFYERDGNCIQYYAEVIQVRLVHRSTIKTPWYTRHQKDHLCWLYETNSPKSLANQITSVHPFTDIESPAIGPGPYRFANLFSLLNAKTFNELFLTSKTHRLLKDFLESLGYSPIVKSPNWDIAFEEAEAHPEFHVSDRSGNIAIIKEHVDGHIVTKAFSKAGEKTKERSYSVGDFLVADASDWFMKDLVPFQDETNDER